MIDFQRGAPDSKSGSTPTARTNLFR